MASDPIDYSNARIPSLWIKVNGIEGLAEDNVSKVEALAQSFFLPPPAVSSVPPDAVYLEPLKDIKFFLQTQIQQVYHTLSPYTAPGSNQIPNIVLMICVDALIDHIFYIYRASSNLRSTTQHG